MRIRLAILLSLLIAAAGALSSLRAADAAPERERPAAVDGTQYAVIAPLYIGQGGFYSYLRLFNGDTSSSATFTVKVVGSPSGRDYGTATYAVPARAGKQLSLSSVLTDAGATIGAPDTGFSFYLRTTQQLAGYQHVTHSPGENYFENSAVCRTSLQDVISSQVNRVFVWGVHTSDPIVGAYPAALELHNYASSPVTYRLSLIEEVTGAVVGQMSFATQANASYSIPISEIESAVGWKPSSGQIRANIMIETPDGSAPQVLAGQTIINNSLRVTLNMTTACATPAAPSPSTNYALTVTKSGSGEGTITSSPAGITCSGSTGCSASFTGASSVTLTAAPASNSSFTGWSGACSGTGTCRVTMDAARSVTGTFAAAAANYTLSVRALGTGAGTVTSSPSGISCRESSGCSASFRGGTSVSLTAAAHLNAAFRGWSGACSGTGTCIAVMNSDKDVVAGFESTTDLGQPRRFLEVRSVGPGSGTVTSNPSGLECDFSQYCGRSILLGSSVTLTATPSANSIFAGWSYDCSGAATCTVVMSQARYVMATFEPINNGTSRTLTVSVAGLGYGTVTSSPAGIDCIFSCTTSFNSGAVVTLTATANASSLFSGWEGGCSSGSGPCTVTMDRAKTVTALFSLR